jgi:hypothetical protein
VAFTHLPNGLAPTGPARGPARGPAAEKKKKAGKKAEKKKADIAFKEVIEEGTMANDSAEKHSADMAPGAQLIGNKYTVKDTSETGVLKTRLMPIEDGLANTRVLDGTRFLNVQLFREATTYTDDESSIRNPKNIFKTMVRLTKLPFLLKLVSVSHFDMDWGQLSPSRLIAFVKLNHKGIKSVKFEKILNVKETEDMIKAIKDNCYVEKMELRFDEDSMKIAMGSLLILI